MERITWILIVVIAFSGSCKPQSDASNDKLKDSITSDGTIELTSPAGLNSSLPYLTLGDDKQLYLSWLEEKQDSTYLYYSKWQENKWAPASLITSGNNWFVNWADYPMIAVNKHGQMMAHYLVKSDTSAYAYDVTLRTSVDGLNWSEPFTPHQDGTATEHGFVSMVPMPDGSFQTNWLDGRHTGGHNHEQGAGAMTLRTAQVSVNGDISHEVELDSRVCDCCQTTATIVKGQPVVFYRDRSSEEIRDMSMAYLQNGLWADGQNLHSDRWKIAGCPVNGPRAASWGSTLAVAWFTAANNQPLVKMKFIQDLDSIPLNAVTLPDSNALGRVDLAWVDSNQVLVSWLSKTGDGAGLKIARIDSSGQVLSTSKVVHTSAARNSGFPQLAVSHGTPFLAWTEVDSLQNTRVKVALIE